MYKDEDGMVYNVSKCTICNGRGEVRKGILGSKDCGFCDGRGRVWENSGVPFNSIGYPGWLDKKFPGAR